LRYKVASKLIVTEVAVPKVDVLGVSIGIVTKESAVEQLNFWRDHSDVARLVTFSTAHMLVEANKDPDFQKILRQADLNCPDGAPVAWLAKLWSKKKLSRTSGPDFMPLFCKQGVALGHSHFIYGGGQGVAESASKKMQEHFPGIKIAGWNSPPFRPLTPEEDLEVCRQINDSGADFVWVCLGCPKQERWMFEHRQLLRVKGILAVGLAVDVMAGSQTRAPKFLQEIGLEWIYRLFQEPRRLWRRYLLTNFAFCYLVLREVLQSGSSRLN
jgi:N-acetylglucosaminyldiphosphoundecaprenol N-acetyl-beta-D-mannosaminyltransferase